MKNKQIGTKKNHQMIPFITNDIHRVIQIGICPPISFLF
jgi:hypothetical protein